MKIGVSGASGHLGRAVVSELLQRPDGHEVVAITRTPDEDYRRGRNGRD
jgi:NAD(P)H dehydrogenase (quinone)